MRWKIGPAKNWVQTPQNYSSKVTANLNIHLEDPVFSKTNHRELHKTNIQERAANVKKDGVMIMKGEQLEHQHLS